MMPLVRLPVRRPSCEKNAMDTSTISLAGYTFDADSGCFTCIHVMEGAPVLLFLHESNGDLQFMCGADDHDFGDDCRFIHTAHVLAWHTDSCR